MAGAYCPRCATNVILEHDGSCSNCRMPIASATKADVEQHNAKLDRDTKERDRAQAKRHELADAQRLTAQERQADRKRRIDERNAAVDPQATAEAAREYTSPYQRPDSLQQRAERAALPPRTIAKK